MAAITNYSDALHRQAVIELWNAVFGYETAHNTPGLAIDKKRPSRTVCSLLP